MMTTHQMSFAELTLNPSVDPQDEHRLGKQQMAIWRLFEKRENGRIRYIEVSTNELCQVAHQYGARLNELRHYLRRFGLTIDLTVRRKCGNNIYTVTSFQGSNYQKYLLRKGLP